MAKKVKGGHCCGPMMNNVSCKVESLVSVDERGQMILPKELRSRTDIKTGDKLVLVSFEREGKVCCISLIKAEVFSGMVKGMLGPLMEGMFNNGYKTK